jgi:folate-binding Fe-S cluster repair protein YgfZ
VLPAEAGLTETHVSFSPEKGCYPGQEPIARLHYRGKANRGLRTLEAEGVLEPEAEVLLGDKAVGRITSAVPGLALAYVRNDVPPDAELTVAGRPVRST